jgi:protein-tyrosine-phosphatase
MKKVLFICHANVGRSQMAEGFYNCSVRNAIAISAGLDPTSPEKYVHPTEKIIQVMKEENIDVSNNTVKLLTEDMINNSQEVYVLCEKELCPQYIQENEKVVYYFIQDPYEIDIDGTRTIRDEIKDFIQTII